MTPSATSSPREEPNGLEDSVNGAPVKRPHSPTEEEMAKRHKEAEVSCGASHLDEPGVAGTRPEVLTLCRFHCRWCPTTTPRLKSPIHPPLTATPTEKEPVL